jgi:hypothetical protein
MSVYKIYAPVGSNHVDQAMSFYDALLGAGGCFYGDVAKGMHTFTSTMRFVPHAGSVKRQSELRPNTVSRQTVRRL